MLQSRGSVTNEAIFAGLEKEKEGIIACNPEYVDRVEAQGRLVDSQHGLLESHQSSSMPQVELPNEEGFGCT
jgi:hypothetical protein